MNEKRKQYPSDVSDEEWAFCAAYLTLMTEVAPQRVYPLREIFNALRYQVKAGGVWRTICRHGTLFTSKPSAGSKRVVSRQWPTICEPFSVWLWNEKPIPAPSF